MKKIVLCWLVSYCFANAISYQVKRPLISVPVHPLLLTWVLDGKRLCGSGADSKDSIVHMVSAWSDANNLVLGSYKVDDKSWQDNSYP